MSLLITALIPFMKPPPSQPNHFLKPSHWALGFQCMNSGGENKHSIYSSFRAFTLKRHGQGYPQSIGQSTHKSKPDIESAETVYSVSGGIANCGILLEGV